MRSDIRFHSIDILHQDTQKQCAFLYVVSDLDLLGHLLLGATSHSKRGIMQSRWNRHDLEAAFFGHQIFTAKQAIQIHANLRAREEDERTLPANQLSALGR